MKKLLLLFMLISTITKAQSDMVPVESAEKSTTASSGHGTLSESITHEYAFSKTTTSSKFSSGIHFSDQKKNHGSEDQLGRHILAFSPFGISLTTSNQDMPDMSIGMSYERISRNGYIGFRLPVVASLNNPYYYFLPTVKLYPTKQGKAKYAVGPQLLIAKGRVNVAGNYNPNLNEYELVSKERLQFGFMLNNSFNFTIARHVFIGIDMSLGIVYYDSEPNAVYSSNGIPFGNSNQRKNSVNPATQIGFNMGYRF